MIQNKRYEELEVIFNSIRKFQLLKSEVPAKLLLKNEIKSSQSF